VTTARAHIAYNILVLYAGADPARLARNMFVQSLTGDHGIRGVEEYRFQGDLGFGGKFFLCNFERPYISCYGEDMTAERARTIARVNRLLELLFTGEPEEVPF